MICCWRWHPLPHTIWAFYHALPPCKLPRPCWKKKTAWKVRLRLRKKPTSVTANWHQPIWIHKINLLRCRRRGNQEWQAPGEVLQRRQTPSSAPSIVQPGLITRHLPSPPGVTRGEDAILWTCPSCIRPSAGAVNLEALMVSKAWSSCRKIRLLGRCNLCQVSCSSLQCNRGWTRTPATVLFFGGWVVPRLLLFGEVVFGRSFCGQHRKTTGMEGCLGWVLAPSKAQT